MWPPTGIALAALLLGGYRLWPGVFLGALAANAYIDEPIYTMVGIAVGNTAGPLAGAYLLRLFKFDRTFSHVRDVAVFVFFGSVAGDDRKRYERHVATRARALERPGPHSGRCGACGGSATPPASCSLRRSSSPGATRSATASCRAKPAPLELAILIAATLAFSLLEFFGKVPMAFPLYPFVVWAALRAGIRPTTALMVVVCGFALVGDRARVRDRSTNSPPISA